MVLHGGKLGQKTPNYVCSRCHYINSRRRQGLICKFLLNSSKLNQTDKEKTITDVDRYLSDGSITSLEDYHYFTQFCVYSLNKRKRWTLPQKITNLIDDGELDEENFRLVMHERVSGCPYTYHSSTRNRNAISYHDSKYSIHHSYPKKKLSSFLDLKMKCHDKHTEVVSEPATVKSRSTQKSRRKRVVNKPHSRGIQRLNTHQTPQEKTPKVNIRDVLNGTIHKVPVPEVRYEVNYPQERQFCCDGHQDWYGDAVHCKAKGSSKPACQWYFKNITDLDKQMYQEGFRDDFDSLDEEEFYLQDYSDEEAVSYLHNKQRQTTLADFCYVPIRKQEQPFHNSQYTGTNKSPNHATSDTSGAYYGKGKVIYEGCIVQEPGDEQPIEDVEVKSAVTKDTDMSPSWVGVDFESGFCTCVLKKDSWENYRMSATNNSVAISSCIPQMMSVSLSLARETTSGSLIFWQRSGWSKCLDEDPEYWVQVRGQMDMVGVDVLSSLLQTQLEDHITTALTVQQVTAHARIVLDKVKGHDRRKIREASPGHLTASVCGSHSEVRTVDDVYHTLASTGDTRGHTNDTLGHASDTRGHTNDTLEHASDTQGHTNDTLGHASDTRGHTNDTLEHASNTQGHTNDTLGHVGDTRGHTNDTLEHASDTQGHTNDTLGHASDTQGHTNETLGHASNTQGHTNDTQDMDALLLSYDVLSCNMTHADEFGFCATCLDQSDDPLTDGCVLLPCEHYFCLDCWRRHIWEKIREGAHKILCQTYKCMSVVDEVMVRTLMPCDVGTRWAHRIKESEIERSQLWSWCPNASCRKVAKVSRPGKMLSAGVGVPIMCDCDEVWCFSCQSGVHWPATCDQNTVYRKMLAQNGDEMGWMPLEKLTYYVEVKKCPKCKYPMEKNGGCQTMRCKCSHSFCWECLRDWTQHVTVGYTGCEKYRKQLITMELDNTIAYPLPIRLYKKSVEHRHKWKRILTIKCIQTKARTYALKSAKRKMTKHIHEVALDCGVCNRVESHLIFIREVHFLMENVYVMLSNVTHRSRKLPTIQYLLDKLSFCLSQLEQIFGGPQMTDDLFRRCDRLQMAVRQALKVLSFQVPSIQQRISASR